jgi:hypothetical protein
MYNANRERLFSIVSEHVNQLNGRESNDIILSSIFDAACQIHATPEDWIETMKHYHQLIKLKQGGSMYNES